MPSSSNNLPKKTLERWLELDLSAEAAAGELPRAFCRDALVDRLSCMLDLERNLIVTGETGVGKTALIHELVCRAHEGRGPRAFEGKRVLQISFERGLSALTKPKQIGSAFRKLCKCLVQRDDVVVFFSDIHQVYRYDLECQLQAFTYAFPGRILGEGEPSTVRAILNCFPRLSRKFITIPVEEPSTERAAAILAAWADHGNAQRFSEGAREESLYLSQRFLSRLRQPRKALELLAQTAQGCTPEATVERADVIDRFCQSHQAPRWLLDPATRLDLSEVEERFNTQVVGQPEAVRAVVSMVGKMKAGLSDTRRPFGVFLFVGPTGVGKTYLAQHLAEEIFGDADRVIRINMGDFSTPDGAEILFGDPDNRSVAASRGLLSRRLLGHPLAVVLLDEFEKCHPTVHDAFMQLFDEGRFINGAGETVSCRSNILIATSNAGAEHPRDLGFGTLADRAARVAAADLRLRTVFRLELLNRFDHVLHFHPLSRAGVAHIAQLELKALAERPGMKQRGLRLRVDPSVLDWLVDRGFDAEFGVRFLKRTIERHVTASLADAVVRSDPPWGSTICLRADADRLRAEVLVTEPTRADRPLAELLRTQPVAS